MKLSYKKFHLRLVLWLTIALSACNLNRAPIVWIHDVKPQFVCPGDSVTLSWDGGDESSGESGCLGDACDAVTVGISSNPVDVINPPLVGLRSQGEAVAGPINSNTTFSFSATGGRDIRSPGTHDVNLVLPDRITTVPLDFSAGCSGSTVYFHGVDLTIPEFRSEGVRLVRVCNTSSEQVSLRLTFGSDAISWVLLPGRCTEDLPSELGWRVLAAEVFLIGGSPGGARCDTSLSLPPNIDMVAMLACDVMTASEPIVIATPETITPEATQSGIIPLYTDTPIVPYPFTLIVQVPANCRKGPGVAYDVVNSALAGEQVEVVGKSADGIWWYGKVDNDQCFISNIAGTPTGDLNSLPVIPAPPTPVPTKTEAPQQQEQPTAIPEIDFDQDGYGVSADCNDKNAAIHPGAVETPDDKVDSNCNGDDDK